MQPLDILLHILGHRRRRHQQTEVGRRLAAPVVSAAVRGVIGCDVISDGSGQRAEPERGRTLRGEGGDGQRGRGGGVTWLQYDADVRRRQRGTGLVMMPS